MGSTTQPLAPNGHDVGDGTGRDQGYQRSHEQTLALSSAVPDYGFAPAGESVLEEGGARHTAAIPGGRDQPWAMCLGTVDGHVLCMCMIRNSPLTQLQCGDQLRANQAVKGTVFCSH